MSNKTLALIKPDATDRQLVDSIVKDIQCHGFSISSMKQLTLDKKTAEEFYVEHKDREFFGDLVSYMTSGVVVAIKLEGDNAVSSFRAMLGETDPLTSPEGTIRKKYGISRDMNSVHGSDSDSAAERELRIIFGD